MKNYILKSILCLIILFNYQPAQTQIKESDESFHKCIVGIWPSEVDQVNGLMFKFWSTENNDKDFEKGIVKLPTTNGLELDLNPLGPFAAGMIFFHYLLDDKARIPLKDSVNYQFLPFYRKINGIQIALLNLEPTKMNGIEIHLAGSLRTSVNGVSIGIIANKRDKLNGVGIGILGNSDTEVNGLQVGLFNQTNHLKGIQIGLWNTNEKRSLPFINWNF